MSRWTLWLRRAVTPTKNEVRHVSTVLPEEILHVCRESTSPTTFECLRIEQLGQPADPQASSWTTPQDGEALQLLSRLQSASRPRTHRAAKPWVIAGGIGLMVVACLLFFIPKPSPVEAPIAYGAPPISIGTTTRVNSGTALAFGPSIQMDASATIRVRQANESGTVIDLNEGTVHFDVDPVGEYRHLQIQAGEVVIRVKGTVFDVHREGGSVDVKVERGAVLVAHNGQETLVTTQQSWSNRSPKRLPPVAPSVPLTEPIVAETTVPSTPQARPKRLKKNPRSPTSKAKQAESVNILTVNIPNHVQALHDIMTRRDAGAPLDELREMVIRYQKDHNNTEHVLRALDILVQATLEKGETSASILVLSEWIDASQNSAKPMSRKQDQYRWLRATLYRDKQNNCSLASEDYTMLAESSDEPIRSRAQAWLGLCLADPKDKTRALRWLTSAKPRHLGPELMEKVDSRIRQLNATP